LGAGVSGDKTKNCLLLICSLLVGIGLVELGLAFYFPSPYSIENNMYFESDPYTGYKLKANGQGHFYGGIKADANSHGHRDDEVELGKPDGVFRILVLGDSFAIGANVEQDQAFPQLLEKQLAEGISAGITSRIEVVNAAVGGWAPYHYARYFEHYGIEYQPDLVLVAFFVGNDTYAWHAAFNDLKTAVQGRRVSQEAASARLIGLKVFLYDNSHLFRRIFTSNAILKTDFRRTDCQDFLDTYLVIQRSRVKVHRIADPSVMLNFAAHNIAALQDIRDMAKTIGAETTVVLVPDENQINPRLQERVLMGKNPADFDFNMPQSFLIDKLKELEIAVIDLLPAFRQQTKCLYLNDTHWTPGGHQLAATVIYDELRAKQLLDD
jgi:hypothetical protein